MQAASHRGRFLPLMAALTATAWLALWLWGQSPYGRYLDHGSWAEIGVAGSLCRALPGGRDALTASLVVGGWVLMLSAMMLPTTLPLLDIFRRLTARRADRRWLTALVIIGYLAVWGVFGLAAHLADWGVAFAVRQSEWLVANVWVTGAAILAIAGGYQFTELKYRCLDKCRAPLGFVIEHWRGVREKRQAFFFGRQTRRILRRLLLVPDAADVRDRLRQYRLDAGIRRGHGGRKEPARWAPARGADRRRPAACSGLGCPRRRDRLIRAKRRPCG